MAPRAATTPPPRHDRRRRAPGAAAIRRELRLSRENRKPLVHWTFVAALAVVALIYGVRGMTWSPPPPPKPSPVPAEIVFVRPNPDASHGTIAMVLCRSTIDGRRRAGYCRIPATFGPESAEAIRARYPVGGTIQVYWRPVKVQPRSSQRSLEPSLEPPPTPSRAAQAFVPFVRLLGCALFAVLVGLVFMVDRPSHRPGAIRASTRRPVVYVYELTSRQIIGSLILTAACAIAAAGILHYVSLALRDA